MELDIETKQRLTDLLAKPAMASDEDISMLTDLVKTYPYYQPLHLLLAKASKSKPTFEHLVTSASLYNGGRLAYQMANAIGVFGDDLEIASKLQPEKTNDEQETFEEINEIENLPVEKEVDFEQEDVFDEISEVDALEFAMESIGATDFFALDQHLNTELVRKEAIVTQPEEYNQEAEAQTISKYDDDKLPYTFLWWLAKTRKEHEQIFQPYVSTKQSTTVQQGDLQHQYVEHIFHLQTPFNVADEGYKGPLNLKTKPKGIEIIDSFIKNDPQIKAPKAEQINTENKAKKSAEDNYDLVSETLAAIYIEQMLYHKAIDTYEKLSLKFPEKSRYFADLIQSLEKKI